MKSWWIGAIGVAVVALAAALLFLPKSNLGGSAAPTETFTPLAVDINGDGIPDAGESDVNLPLRGGRSLGDHVDELNRKGANPYALASRAARTTPETELSAHIQSSWVRIGQLLSAHETEPAAASLRAESAQFLEDLREMRRHPQDYQWTKMEERQTDLMKRLDASPYVDDEMRSIFAHLNEKVSGYHSGAFAVPEPNQPTAP